MKVVSCIWRTSKAFLPVWLVAGLSNSAIDSYHRGSLEPLEDSIFFVAQKPPISPGHHKHVTQHLVTLHF